MVDARGLPRRPRPPRQTECGLGTGLSARRTLLNSGAHLAACLCNLSEPASGEVIDKRDTGRAMGTSFPIKVPLRTRRDTGSRRAKGCLGATLANCQAAVIHPPAIAPLAFPTQGARLPCTQRVWRTTPAVGCREFALPTTHVVPAGSSCRTMLRCLDRAPWRPFSWASDAVVVTGNHWAARSILQIHIDP